MTASKVNESHVSPANPSVADQEHLLSKIRLEIN